MSTSSLHPIAIKLPTGRYVAGFRVLEDGLGTDETLTLETPARLFRREALADARAWGANPAQPGLC